MLRYKNYFLTSLQIYHVYNSHSFINNNHLLKTTVKIIIFNMLHVTSWHFTNSVDGLKHVSPYCVSQEIRANTLHDEVRVQPQGSLPSTLFRTGSLYCLMLISLNNILVFNPCVVMWSVLTRIAGFIILWLMVYRTQGRLTNILC